MLTHVFILLLMNTRCIEEKRTCHVARMSPRASEPGRGRGSARINERTMMRIVDMVNYGSLRALYKPIRIVELD